MNNEVKLTNLLHSDNSFLDPSKCYILCPADLGDTFVVAGLRQAIMQEYQADLVFLIKEKHKIVMELFGIHDYMILSSADEGKLKNKFFLQMLSDLCPIPQKGRIFVSDPYSHFEINNDKNHYEENGNTIFIFESLRSAICHVFRLPEDCHWYPPPPPFLALSVSEDFRQKVSHIADLQKIVLLAPETFYIKSASEDFWTKEVNYWITRGFSVLINSIAPVSYPNAMHLPMSLKEALWLGVSCHHVTTLATGFSCLLSFFQHSLTVVYTSHFDFWYFNFFKNFHLQHIHEIILPRGEMWGMNGIPLSVISDTKILNRLKWNYELMKFLSYMSFGKSGEKIKRRMKRLKKRIAIAREARNLLSCKSKI